MSIFSRFRKRGDVIDLTELNKRGLLKIPEQVPDYVEIGKTNTPANSNQTQGSPLGFFGAIANSVSQTETSSSNNFNSNNNVFSNSLSNLDETQESRKERLRRRFSEMQDKVERFSSDIYDIKHRLELIEKKLNRIERKEGIKAY